MRLLATLLIALGAATAAGRDGPPRGGKIAVPRLADGFEADKLADFWLPGDHGTGLHVPGSVTLSKEHARTGGRSARLVLREGDVDAMGDDGKHVERTEIDSGRYPLLGADVYYGFSELIPEDFPVVDNRLVISQIKQSGVEGSPMIGQRFVDGSHFLTIRAPGAGESGEKHRLPEIRPGHWFDMVYRVRYSEGADGLVDVWMDGKRAFSYRGPTASKSGEDRFYHKVGLYRDRLKAPMTIYVDNYAIGESYEEVDPAKFGARH